MKIRLIYIYSYKDELFEEFSLSLLRITYKSKNYNYIKNIYLQKLH